MFISTLIKRSLIFSSFSLCVLLTACGQDDGAAESVVDATPEAEVTAEANAAEKGSIAKDWAQLGDVSFRLIKPEEYGGNWQRELLFNGYENEAMLTVEKQIEGDDRWRVVGFTNTDGAIIDEEINQSVRYRLGGQLLSEYFPAIRDHVITGGAMSRNVDLKAYRIVLPESQTLRIGGYHLNLEADSVVINGVLEAHDPGTSGGRNAGSVNVRARVLEGNGRIWLRGQKGAPSSRGRAGATGPDQHCVHARSDASTRGGNGTNASRAGTGGVGGELFFLGEQVLLKNIRIDGGGGGNPAKGGAAGLGGRLRSCAIAFEHACHNAEKNHERRSRSASPLRWPYYENTHRTCKFDGRRGSSGSAGKDSTRGAGGAPGRKVIQHTHLKY